MKANIVCCSFGFLAFDDENRLIDKSLFPRNSQDAAQKLVEIEHGKIVKELTALVNSLKDKGFNTFAFENEVLAREVQKQLNVKTTVSTPLGAGEIACLDMEKLAVEANFVENVEEFKAWTHRLTVELAKLRVKSAGEKKDLLLVQAVQTLDDLDKTLNLFMGRLREWYGIHFPELNRLIEKHETYVRLILNLGRRENFTVESLEVEDIPKTKAQQIAGAAEKSMGADLSEKDMQQIQALCRGIAALYKLRENLEDYLDNTMEEVAPNIKALAGSLLGARLIALAGSLTNLARIPASTIQVIGAEKSLFRSLKTGAKPPKHGIIFQHAYLHEAKKWHRGKIARALAGKLAIAARADAFGGRYIGEELKASLEKRLGEIREKHVEPPPMKERKRRRRRGN